MYHTYFKCIFLFAHFFLQISIVKALLSDISGSVDSTDVDSIHEEWKARIGKSSDKGLYEATGNELYFDLESWEPMGGADIRDSIMKMHVFIRTYQDFKN